jgi:hypothetical protein
LLSLKIVTLLIDAKKYSDIEFECEIY